MSDPQQYPTIVMAGADPAWMFDMQQHLRSIVGWDYDLLLTFSAGRAMRYVTERQVRLLITEAAFLHRTEGSGVDLARRAREHSRDIQVLLIHDGAPPASPDIGHALLRRASAEQIYTTLLAILAPDGSVAAGEPSSAP